jgi:hypothetical protein
MHMAKKQHVTCQNIVKYLIHVHKGASFLNLFVISVGIKQRIYMGIKKRILISSLLMRGLNILLSKLWKNSKNEKNQNLHSLLLKTLYSYAWSKSDLIVFACCFLPGKDDIIMTRGPVTGVWRVAEFTWRVAREFSPPGHQLFESVKINKFWLASPI